VKSGSAAGDGLCVFQIGRYPLSELGASSQPALLEPQPSNTEEKFLPGVVT